MIAISCLKSICASGLDQNKQHAMKTIFNSDRLSIESCCEKMCDDGHERKWKELEWSQFDIPFQSLLIDKYLKTIHK